MAKPPVKTQQPAAKAPATAAERALLAIRVLVHPNISLAKSHVSGINDSATARTEITESMFLLKATRSCYENAPCGSVAVNEKLMRSMLDLGKTYEYHVSELAGGSHSKKSRHYAGIAMDVDTINGHPVSAKNKDVAGFIAQCRKLGATEVLGPGDKGHDGHVHCAWPRPK